MVVKPNSRPQELFLSTSADIAIYGGSAGSGKTFSLLMEPLRHVTRNPDFYAVGFRRVTPEIRNPGGLWDESVSMYSVIAGATPKSSTLEWEFAKGGRVKFSHLEHEHTVQDWQGSQVPLIMFDEITHFSESQFFYMLSRNRSKSGVAGYVRATCNPDPDSWVAKFIAWWIDQDTGFPIPERSGALRWFIRVNGVIVWGDTPDDLKDQYGQDVMPKSVTFVAATIYDNVDLLRNDPAYLANLKALPPVEQARLLGGNWKVRPAAGDFFRTEWIRYFDEVPRYLKRYGASDYAVTEEEDNNDPDWTEHGIVGTDKDKNIYVLDWRSFRTSPDKWIASQLKLQQQHEPQVWFGEGGVIRRAVQPLMKLMMREDSNWQVMRWINPINDKAARARSIQGRMSQGCVFFPSPELQKLPQYAWVQPLLNQLHAFTGDDRYKGKDDKVDVMGLIGLGLDSLAAAEQPKEKKEAPQPGSIAWVLANSKEEKQASPYR